MAFAVCLFALISFPHPARAQSDDTLMLMNRLNDLEAQVQQLNRRAGAAPATGGAYTGMAPGTAGSADADVRIGQLQDQIRNLTGEIETQGNEIAQLRTETQRLNEDMQMRLNTVEARTGGGGVPPATPHSLAPPDTSMYAAPAPTTTPSQSLGTLVPGPDGSVPASSVAAPAATTPGSAATPEKEYEAAYNMLGQSDYAGAETGFNAFLQHHPKHPLAANAQYWLGETYFQRGMLDKAAATFAQSYKQYPSGAKAPESLLKLGMALGQQGKTKQACVSFGELAKQFPAASQKVKTSLAQEKARYACE